MMEMEEVLTSTTWVIKVMVSNELNKKQKIKLSKRIRVLRRVREAEESLGTTFFNLIGAAQNEEDFNL